ncbi:hypothetical protein CWR43_28070 [Rhizobium sullae]|uniref:Uncharacterized protein n=1 Tax=Rhizobium sullae TaxID=50338 RepID=A0A2N0D321_RHISU|nr:hypothetical protein CWR43_28070 [Rhizobium sullae]
MKYVLIFVLITKGFGSFSVTTEFDTIEACETANIDLREMHAAVSEPHNAYIHGKCYPKGN